VQGSDDTRNGSSDILAAYPWRTNAELIADVAKLGYLRREWLTLDPTYGEAGGFWKVWRPDNLIAHDLKLDGVNFTDLPYSSGKFDAVVFDPPYKLSGKPASAGFDTRYGVDKYMSPEARIALMVDGFTECARMPKARGYLLAKCADQVCSRRKWWQTDILTNHAADLGYRKVDRFDMLRRRPQPPGRGQDHSRGHSTLLVFQREAS
jgi:hypothetical protein